MRIGPCKKRANKKDERGIEAFVNENTDLNTYQPHEYATLPENLWIEDNSKFEGKIFKDSQFTNQKVAVVSVIKSMWVSLTKGIPSLLELEFILHCLQDPVHSLPSKSL